MMYVYKFELFHDGAEKPYRTFIRAFDDKYQLADIVKKILKVHGADEITCTALFHCNTVTP